MLAILSALLLAQAVPAPPRPQPTASSCWVATCAQSRTSDGTELTSVCPIGSRPRMMTFDPADTTKGDAPIIVCLCCPGTKVKVPPRVFEEKTP